MFGLAHKLKLGQTQKLMAAALMLAVSPAWGEIKWVYRTGSPEKIAEEVSFCQQIHDTIEQTPDFWERFEKEGFHYILTASPFKHYRVERIHPVVVLTAGLHDYLREKQDFMSSQLVKISKGVGSLKSLAYEIKVSKQYFYEYEPVDVYDYDWGERYKENFIHQYIDYYDPDCESDCRQLGNDFFAYRIKSNFYNRLDINEYTIGIMNYRVSNKNKKQRSRYHVVDKYMQPHPKINSKASYYNMPAGFPYSSVPGWWNRYVPIYVNGRSYHASVRKISGFGDSWKVFVEKSYRSNRNTYHNKTLCSFEF